MKIIVCVKQVPDTSGKVAVKEDGTMDRAAMATITNPDDLNAVEAALQIKDQNHRCCKVVVISMGPASRRGHAAGAAGHGCGRGGAGLRPGVRRRGYLRHLPDPRRRYQARSGVEEDDIIFCGRQAIDGDTAQVGPQIAEKLDVPQVSYAADIDGRRASRHRQAGMLEDGYMTIKVQTPCLLTCIKELNTPRYMSVERHHGVLSEAAGRSLTTTTLKDDPLIDRGHHRPEGLSHQRVQVLLSPGEGRRHDARGGRQGHL